MIHLSYVPDGLADMVATYGCPWRLEGETMVPDRDWEMTHLMRLHLPHPMRPSWQETEIRAFPVHRLVAESMKDALLEIFAHGGPEWLRKHDLDRWGGCYNPRMKTGRKEPSVHWFACAIDINPLIAPYGAPGRQPAFIVDAFRRRGWVWGGEWEVPDEMHIQAVTGY